MGQKRGTLARIGILLLNLIAPGLGLLRLCRWKLALALIFTAISVSVLLDKAPPVSFPILVQIIAAGLITYPIAMGLSWHFSEFKTDKKHWYCRWYTVAVVGVSAFLVSYWLSNPQSIRFKNFYVPSESMSPTLTDKTKFVAYMGTPQDPRRGDIVLVRSPGRTTYVTRLVGLPGDEIAVKKGVIILNGQPVPQQLVGTNKIAGYAGVSTARRLREQFPGETSPHEIYDDGVSIGDNVEPQRVRAGHVFLLGDNRDHAADSRFSAEEMGLEQLPISDILGWPMYHGFGSNRPMGQTINRRDLR